VAPALVEACSRPCTGRSPISTLNSRRCVPVLGPDHLVLAVRRRTRLADLHYDFDRMRELMIHTGLVTLHLVWQEAPLRYHARNPFPVGGVVEDPATGAAAAAIGTYLRHLGVCFLPAKS